MINWNIIKNELKQDQIKFYLNWVKRQIEYCRDSYQEIIDSGINKVRKIIFYKLSKNIWYSPENYGGVSYGQGYLLDDETQELVIIDADSDLSNPSGSIDEKEIRIILNYELTKQEYINICDELINKALDTIREHLDLSENYKKELHWKIKEWKKLIMEAE